MHVLRTTESTMMTREPITDVLANIVLTRGAKMPLGAYHLHTRRPGERK